MLMSKFKNVSNCSTERMGTLPPLLTSLFVFASEKNKLFVEGR